MLIRLEPSFIACKWVPTSTRDCTGLYIYLHSTSNYCLLRETFFFPANIKQRDRLGHKLFSVPVNQCFFTRIRKEGRKEENNPIYANLTSITSIFFLVQFNWKSEERGLTGKLGRDSSSRSAVIG